MIRKILLGFLLFTPLAIYPFLRDSGANQTYVPPPPSHTLDQDQRMAIACLAIVPAQSFPAALPWGVMCAVGEKQSEALERKARYEPIEFLQECLNRYESDVRGYRCIMLKHERVNGKMRPKEKLLVQFRENPFSVRMEWLEGIELAHSSLYVAGENDGLLNVRLRFSFGPVMPKKVDASDVMATSRFPITQFGTYIGAVDTLEHMRKAEERKKLFVRYEGIEKIDKTGNRPCYKFVRAPYDPPEADDINELTIYIDCETLMQVGSILRDSDGKLIAEYFFRDFELNPNFDPKVFKLKSNGGTF